MKKSNIALLTAFTTLGLALTGCGSTAQTNDDTTTVKLGIVGSIYEDIWTPTKEELAKDGINLEFVQFSDYVTPNNALSYGEIDLNAFQHRIYLEAEIEAHSYEIENVGNTFIIPLNAYSSKITSIDQVKDGDIVAIPDDVTNGGRALKILESAGLITVDKNAGFNPRLEDITAYNVEIEIKELKANTIASALPDVTLGVINGNYALDFGLDVDSAVISDTSLDEELYWNLIASRSEDLQDEETRELYQKIVDVFQSQATQDVFDEQFGGYFRPVGWGQKIN